MVKIVSANMDRCECYCDMVLPKSLPDKKVKMVFQCFQFS